jgi:two-component SAPR family response regulator
LPEAILKTRGFNGFGPQNFYQVETMSKQQNKDSNKDKVSWLIFKANYHLRFHNYEDCIKLCDEVLKLNPLEQSAWCLKARALTNAAYIGEDQENIADEIFENHAISTSAAARYSTLSSV